MTDIIKVNETNNTLVEKTVTSITQIIETNETTLEKKVGEVIEVNLGPAYNAPQEGVSKTYVDEADSVLQVQITSNDVDIAALQSDTAGISGDVASLQVDVVQNTSDIADNASDITVLQTDVASVSGDVADNASDITDLQTDVASVSAATITNASDIDDIEIDISNIESDIIDIQSDVTDLQTDVASVSASTVTNASDIATNATNISTNTGNIATNSSDITSLQTATDTISGDLDSLEARVESIDVQGGEGINVSETVTDIFVVEVDDYISKTEVASVSGDLQTQIDASTGFTPLEGTGMSIESSGADYVFSVEDYVSKTEVSEVSGNLQTQIDAISGGFTPIASTGMTITPVGSDYEFAVTDYIGRTEVAGISAAQEVRDANQDIEIAINGVRIDNLTTYVDSVSGNTDTNAAAIATNASNISTNAGNISTNASNISDNASDISVLRVDVDAISGDLSQAEADIVQNTSLINHNTSLINDISGADISASDVLYAPGNPLFYYNTGIPTDTDQALDALSDNIFKIRASEILLSSTGLIDGGNLSVFSPIAVSISAGNGLITDHTDLDEAGIPTISRVTWEDTDVIVPNLSGGTFSLLFLDVDGDPVFTQSLPSRDFYRNNIFLGKILHRIGSVQGVVNLQQKELDIYNQYVDLASAVGPMNLAGNNYEPADPTVDLSLSKSAGNSFRLNYNSDTNIKNPHNTIEGIQNPSTWQYIYRDGAGGHTYVSGQTQVNPENYDDGSGTLASVSSNDYTVQYVYMFAGTGNTYVIYGDEVFNTISDAIDNVNTKGVNGIDVPANFYDASLRAFVITKQGISNFSNSSYYQIIDGGKFNGAVGGGSGGGGIAASQFSDFDFAVYYDSQPDRKIQFDLANLAAAEEITIKANAAQSGNIDITLPSATGQLLTDVNALLLDGSNPMEGDLDLDGNDIVDADNVNIKGTSDTVISQFSAVNDDASTTVNIYPAPSAHADAGKVIIESTDADPIVMRVNSQDIIEVDTTDVSFNKDIDLASNTITANKVIANNVGTGSGAAVEISSTNPAIAWNETDQGVDAARWDMTPANSEMFIRAVNNLNVGSNFLGFTRTDGTATSVKCYTDLVVGTDPGGSAIVRIPNNTTESGIRMGGLEIQSYNQANCWTGNNIYYDGSAYRYREIGAASRIVYSGDNIIFSNAPSGAQGGVATQTDRMTVTSAGVIIGTDPGGSETLRVDGGVNLGATGKIFNGTVNSFLQLNDGTDGVELFGGGNIHLNATTTINLDTVGGVIIGTDPGGSESLRVGGGLRTASPIVAAANSMSSHSNDSLVTLSGGTGFDSTQARLYITGKTEAGNPNNFFFYGDKFAFSPSDSGAGDVVIGTDPGGSEKLRVDGNIRATDFIGNGTNTKITHSAAGALQMYGTGVGEFQVYTNNLLRMKVQSGGSVVIGTDPGGSETLRVDGGINTSVAGASAATTETLLKVRRSLVDDVSGSTVAIRLGCDDQDLAKGAVMFRRTGSYGQGVMRLGARATGDTTEAAWSDLVLQLSASDVVIGTDPDPASVEFFRVGGGIRQYDSVLIHTSVNLSNGSGVSAGSITNAPAAGNPTKWIPIDDNGTTRYIPAW